jgi:hypothetical protein
VSAVRFRLSASGMAIFTRVRCSRLILFCAFPKPFLSARFNYHAQATKGRGSHPAKYSQYNEGRNGSDGPLDHKDHHGPKRHSNIGYNNVTCGFRSNVFPLFCYWSALVLLRFSAVDRPYSTHIQLHHIVLKRFSHLGSVMRLSLYLNQLYYQEVLDKPIRSN